MIKTGIGTLDLVERLGEKLSGIELDKKGVVQVSQGISVVHDERNRTYRIKIIVAGKQYALDIADINCATEIILGMVG
jgi:hypothetical protein